MSSARAATPAITATSSAAVADVSLKLDGVNLTLGDMVGAQGSGPPIYSSQKALPSFSKSLSGPAGSSIAVSAGGVVSRVGCTRPTTGMLVSSGISTAGTVNVAVNTPLGAVLHLSVGAVNARSGFTHTQAGMAVPTGSTKITNLVIGAPLLGIPQKTYSGSPKPNQILFQTPDKLVTVYLNRQTITSAAGKPTSITTDAVAVEIGGKAVGPLSLSGDIVVGTTLAN